VRLAYLAPVLSSALGLAGCGYIGPVLPPALDIPARITDLTVGQFGDNIRADFTLPSLTTEGLLLKDIRAVEVRVGPIVNPFSFEVWIRTTKAYPVSQTTPGPIDFTGAPAAEWIGKEVGVVVHAVGPKGKSSDWSNLRTLTISQPLPTPADLMIENARDGVRITWHGPPRQHYRLFRAAGEEKPEVLDETDQTEYIDHQIDYSARYIYYVQATDGELKQSEMAVSQPFAPVDEFAPSVPAGLTAEQGANSIDLSWERNTEPRFRGYNVYRSVDNGPFQKIADVITAPTFSDRAIEAGKKYRYTVSSVGVNDRESAQSAPFEITAQ
jgi:hypothetical protein